MKEEIIVSVCCMTYNQKAYIEQTINSILEQKTNFKYEVIIHDDCSTDGTIEILKKYERDYPDIIKAIYEKKNLYSQNIKIEPILFNACSGKYIALCEGDDYWCDENKLQKQYDFMDAHKEYSLLFHDAWLYFENEKKFQRRKCMYHGSSDCKIEDLILGTGLGGLFPTCSMFFKTEYVKTLPDFFLNAPVGDMPLSLYLALKGKVYYLSDIMGVYRVNTPGSWTAKRVHLSEQQIIESQNRFDNMMIEFNEYSQKKYDNEVNLYLLRGQFELNLYLKKMDYLKDKKFRKLYKITNLRGKIRYFIIRNFPNTFLFLKKVKNAK